MAQKRLELSENELNNLSNTRVSFHHTDGPKRIQGKVINYNTTLQQRIFRNSNTFIRELVFDDCIFNGVVDIGDYEFAGSVSFEDCVFNNSVKFGLGNVSYSKNCEFNSDLTLVINRSSEAISNLNVKGELKIMGQISDLTLHQINQDVAIINQKIKISNSFNSLIISESLANTLEFEDSHKFNGNLNISKVKVLQFLIGVIVLDTEMNINDCEISSISINKIEGDIRKVTISNSNIELMALKTSHLNNTSISECSISTLTLTDANRTESILNIEKSTIVNLKFEGLYNKGLITLRELKIPLNGIVSIRSTNLGKADFIYCNFAKAGLEFENSKITEAFFSETEFPKKVFVDGKIIYNQSQLTFGQLASAFQKQGDNIRALEYSSREVEAHFKSIKLLSTFFFRKINLALNLISNNFGRDWVRGIIFSFAVGLLFFCLLLISTDEYSFGFIKLDWHLMPAYLKFMNPLRFFELESLFVNTPREEKIGLKSFSYLADFGGRIFVAYGYYQTIQAFRRFGRK